MAVKPEDLDRPAAKLTATVSRAKRSTNGRWGLTVRLAGVVHLTNGRKIKLERDVRLNERHTGTN